MSHGLWYSAEMAFLDRMALCFFIVLLVGIVVTRTHPLANPLVMPVNKEISLETSPVAKTWGIVTVVLCLALYALFW